MTLEAAAAALEISAATLSRIETGVRVPRARDVRDLAVFYGVTDAAQIASLVDLVAGAKESGWWETFSEVDDEYSTYIGLEAAASEIQQYENSVIPALLETPEYIRAYLAGAVSPGRFKAFSTQDIDKRVEVRTRRQQILFSASAPRYLVILDESAVARPVGSDSIMRAQLGHIQELNTRQNIDIRLLPFSKRENPGQLGGFTNLSLPQDVSDVTYIDSLAGQLFLETPDDVSRCRQIFSALEDMSLDKTATQEALQRLSDNYETPSR